MRVIKNMYWGWTATMPVDDEISSLRKKKVWCHTRMCVSPYSKIIMQNLEGHPRIQVGGHNIHHFRYADDTIFIPESKEDLPQLLDIFKEESRKKEMEFNVKKDRSNGGQLKQ